MSVLSKIESAVDAISTINSIAGKVNQLQSTGLLNGINLSNITPDNIGGIGNQLTANLQQQSNSLMESINGSIDVNSIENIANNITPEDVGIDINSMFNDIPGFDPSMLEGISFKWGDKNVIKHRNTLLLREIPR